MLLWSWIGQNHNNLGYLRDIAASGNSKTSYSPSKALHAAFLHIVPCYETAGPPRKLEQTYTPPKCKVPQWSLALVTLRVSQYRSRDHLRDWSARGHRWFRK